MMCLLGMTAGVNAVHRVASLVLAKDFISETQLADLACQESRLTHWSPLSQATCVALCVICRHLINGMTWVNAIQSFLQVYATRGTLASTSSTSHNSSDDSNEDSDPMALVTLHITQALRPEYKSQLNRGGFAPLVLSTAVYFVHHSDSFNQALSSSIDFAGLQNYCPVLVGALAGARYGVDEVVRCAGGAHLAHCNEGRRAGLIARLTKACEKMSADHS